jgi:CheY-like chemotaxis protein
VEVAATCGEAHEKCRWEQFDAITLDPLLPDGPGWEELKRIRSLERHRNTPVVVISARECADLEIPLTVKSLMSKPVHPDQLLGELKLPGVPIRALKRS